MGSQRLARGPLGAALVAVPRTDETEARIQQLGRALYERSLPAVPTALHADWWQERLFEWAMRDARLRTELFRFIDVLPALRTGKEVAEHLVEYLLHGGHVIPEPLERALRFPSPGGLAARLLASAARRNVRQMARRFIAGDTIETAVATVERLRTRHMAHTMDVLGEAVTSDVQADAYAHAYLALIDGLAGAARNWAADSQIDDGPGGGQPRVNVSIKLSALHPQFDPIAGARVVEAVTARVRPILRRARERDAFIYFDTEQYAHKDVILDIAKSVLMEDEFRDWPHAGVVLQAYLTETELDLAALLEWVKRRGQPISVRLVKGAYWDTEMALAAQRHWPCPVFRRKDETDAAFERLTRTLLRNHDCLRPAIASHNLRSLAHAIARAAEYGLSPSDFEIQMLFGMGDPLKAALVERGLRLRIYTPYGPLIPGMGYLIRRLLENTSNDSFLRQSFTTQAPIEQLLAPPGSAPVVSERDTAVAETAPDKQAPPGGTRGLSIIRTTPVVAAAPPASAAAPSARVEEASFTNEPLTDFRLAAKRGALAEALAEVRAEHCGTTYPLIIGSECVGTTRHIDSIDPSHPSFVVGRVACAGIAEAEGAVAALRHAAPAWRDTAIEERTTVLRCLAQLMRERRFELAAWIILETGKPWREADADVAEAIDYCELYASQFERVRRQPRHRDVPGEDNALLYEPRGVAVIIAPWNFPLAILTGMTTAALVTGNTVIVKPAEQSPVVAAKLFELLSEAGLPAGVAAFLPGIGEEIGPHLVAHPDVDTIAFTGSRAVGLQILAAAAQPHAGQHTVKRVVAEMGGKNAIIVDADADLDEAVIGVTASAFGYSGQKCSACSRVIVLESIHDAFVKRLVETTRSLPVGLADDPATIVGPLIDAQAQARVQRYIEAGKGEAELVCEVPVQGQAGYLVGPVIFDRVPPRAAIAQDEIFGPVLAVLTATSFEEAMAMSNDTEYGLTGGLYSRRPSHIELAKRELRVGNLYINRTITGAMVDRQPFGGVKLSGVGSKAGGPDYLLQFCEPHNVSENTIRHGFTPE